MVNSYFDPAVKLIYAAGALCGLIGAIRVYSKFSSGDPKYFRRSYALLGQSSSDSSLTTPIPSFLLYQHSE
jgi:hypothetical protein